MVEAAEFYLLSEEERERRQFQQQQQQSGHQTAVHSLAASTTTKPTPNTANQHAACHHTSAQGGGAAEQCLHSISASSANFAAGGFLPSSIVSTTSSSTTTHSNAGNSGQLVSSRRSSTTSVASSSSKAPPQTLKWLMDNFEGSDGVSLPRATLFALYMQHCVENDLEPMNAASFGKMIRSIFSGLRTRRLGTRGNSKYHYYGIKLKQMSSLHKRLAEISMQIQPLPGLSTPAEKRQRSGSQKHLAHVRDLKNNAYAQSSIDTNSLRGAMKRSPCKVPMKCPDLKQFELVNNAELKGFTPQEVSQFCTLYSEHFEASVSAINNCQFEYLCAIWNAFWRNPSIDTSNTSYKIIEQRLPRHIFNALCQKQCVADFIYDSDNRFYQMYSEYIFPDVFSPFDDVMVLNLKNATIDMQSILTNSIQHLPEEVQVVKKRALENFLSHLKEMSSMCHSIESVKAIFRSKSCLNQAQSDYLMIDCAEIKKRLKSLLPHCEDQFCRFEEFLNQFFGAQAMPRAGSSQDSLIDDLLCQAEAFLITVSGQHAGDQWMEKLKAMRQVYVSWCLYSSMLLREMTLRGSCSFGIFQLVRTLLDDYLLYVLKANVAGYSGRPVVCAINEVLI